VWEILYIEELGRVKCSGVREILELIELGMNKILENSGRV